MKHAKHAPHILFDALAWGLSTLAIVTAAAPSARAAELAAELTCNGSNACVVPAPYGARGLRSKEAYLKGQAAIAGDALHAESQRAEAGFLANLKKDMSTRVDCLYKGIDLQPDPDAKDARCTGREWKKSCVLVRNPLVLKDNQPIEEITGDHLGGSCGQTASIGIERIGLTAWRPVVTYAADASEARWLNGAIIHALAYHWKKVASEIESSDQLTIPATSACYSIAADIVNGRIKYATLLNNSRAKLLGASGVRDIDACRQDVRMAAPLLCSARANLETAFALLARCEVTKTARREWATKIGSPVWREQFKKRVHTAVKASCNGTSARVPANVSQMTEAQLNTAADQAVSQANSSSSLSRCYGIKVQDEIRRFLNEQWPLNGSTTQNAQPANQADQAEDASPVHAGTTLPGVFLMIMLALQMTLTGCSKAKDPVEKGDLDSQLSNPGYNPSTYDEELAATALETNDFTVSNAEEYADDSASTVGPNAPGGSTSDTGGAGVTAGNGGAIGVGSSSAATSAGSGSGSGNNTGGSDGTGLSASSGGDSIGGPGSGQISRGLAAKIASTGEAAAAIKSMASLGGSTGGKAAGVPGGAGLDGAGASSVYSGGGAAAAAEGQAAGDGGLAAALAGAAGMLAGSHGGAGESGNGWSNEGGGAPGEDQFGRARGDVSAMGTPDPADYFMKTDIDVSLFKRASSQFNRKAMDWSLAAAEDALARSQQARRPAAQSAIESGGAKVKQGAPKKPRSAMEIWAPTDKTF